MYNVYNFEANFAQFLQDKKVSPVTLKNYLSDFRNFMGWFRTYLLDQGITLSHHDEQILMYLTGSILNHYKQSLIDANNPTTTINRRLASLRAFVTMCFVKNWTSAHLADTIPNLPTQKTQKEVGKETPVLPTSELLKQFKNHLGKTGAQQATIKGYLCDVRQFFSWHTQSNDLVNSIKK